eukprot:1133703-Amorphochlora_amoeboformis.AAC.1
MDSESIKSAVGTELPVTPVCHISNRVCFPKASVASRPLASSPPLLCDPSSHLVPTKPFLHW